MSNENVNEIEAPVSEPSAHHKSEVPKAAKPQRHYSTVDPLRAGVCEYIAGSLARHPPEGFRHLWLGDSGMGKTQANRILIEQVLKLKHVTMVLTTDDKSSWAAQYDGMCRIHPNDLRTNPPRSGEDRRHIVFRGIGITRTPSPEVANLPFDVAQMAWSLVRQHQCSILLNVDELADATNGHQSWNEEDIAQIYRKGRGVGISVVATTQLPQLLPREAFGLSDTIGVFRMSSRETKYLYSNNVLGKDQIDEIEALKVGEFRLFRKSHPLDPNVYKFKL